MEFLNQLIQGAQQINWSSPSWDLFILIFFVVFSLLYGLSLGRDRIIIILVSIYIALAIVNTAPYIRDFQLDVKINEVFAFKVTTFLGIFLFLFFLISRSGLMATFGQGSSFGKAWQIFLFSFLHVGLLISIVLSYLTPTAINHLSPLTRNIFVSPNGQLFWLVAPILAIWLVREKNKD